MAAFELKDSEVAAEGIDRFAFGGFDVFDVGYIGKGAGDGPAFEGWLDVADIKFFLFWGG